MVETNNNNGPKKITIPVHIFTSNTRILDAILESQRATSGQTQVEITPGATLTYETMYQFKGADFPALITLTLTIIEGVAASLIAQWIYDRLRDYKNNRIKLVIDDEQVEVEPDVIEDLLSYRMKQI